MPSHLVVVLALTSSATSWPVEAWAALIMVFTRSLRCPN
jgi:hypothetical protein